VAQVFTVDGRGEGQEKEDADDGRRGKEAAERRQVHVREGQGAGAGREVPGGRHQLA